MDSGARAARELYFERSPNLLAIASAAGEIEDVNAAWASTFPPVERFLDLADPAAAEGIAALWEQAVAGESQWSVDRFRTADGGEIWLAWAASRTVGGEELHIAGRDVTAEQGDVTRGRAVETRLQYEQVFASVAEGIWVLDSEGRTVLINPAAERMTGQDGKDILGEVSHFIIHHSRADGEPYPIEECPIYRSVFQAEPCDVEDEVFWRKDGTSFSVHYTSTPVVGPRGERLGAVQVFRDTTETRAAAPERERLVQLVNNSRDFIGMATTEGRVFFVNDWGRRMLSLPPEGDVPVPILEYLTSDSGRRLAEEALPALAAEGSWLGTASFQDFSDPHRTVEVDVALFQVRDPVTKEPLAIATVARDNADRRQAERAEAQLAQARQLQGQAVQLNDDVVQGLIVTKLALELGQTEKAAAAAARTLGAARSIVSELLTTARPDRGYAPGDLVRTRPAPAE